MRTTSRNPTRMRCTGWVTGIWPTLRNREATPNGQPDALKEAIDKGIDMFIRDIAAKSTQMIYM